MSSVRVSSEAARISRVCSSSITTSGSKLANVAAQKLSAPSCGCGESPPGESWKLTRGDPVRLRVVARAERNVAMAASFSHAQYRVGSVAERSTASWSSCTQVDGEMVRTSSATHRSRSASSW